MPEIIKLIATIAEPFAYLMALVLMASILQRTDRSKLVTSLWMGTLFSATLLFSMENPIDLGPGGIHDMRGLLIGTAAALMGPIVGVMTLAAGVFMRWSIGGPGVTAGIIAMFGTFTGGLMWRYLVRGRNLPMWAKSVLLGVMVSFHLVGLFWLPRDMWVFLFTVMAPMYFFANIVGAWIFNYLLGGEFSFLSEAESLKLVANTDPLTGILNRRGLNRVLPTLKTKHSRKRGRALLYFDIDHFKRANDQHGHAVGDEVLTSVVDRINSSLRANDVFARLGGDEFAVILPDVSLAEARIVAERCRTVVAEAPIERGKARMSLSISLGAIWLDEMTDIDEMLHAADRALYRAKKSGRNSVVFASDLGQEALNSFALAPKIAI